MLRWGNHRQSSAAFDSRPRFWSFACVGFFLIDDESYIGGRVPRTHLPLLCHSAPKRGLWRRLYFPPAPPPETAHALRARTGLARGLPDRERRQRRRQAAAGGRRAAMVLLMQTGATDDGASTTAASSSVSDEGFSCARGLRVVFRARPQPPFACRVRPLLTATCAARAFAPAAAASLLPRRSPGARRGRGLAARSAGGERSNKVDDNLSSRKRLRAGALGRGSRTQHPPRSRAARWRPCCATSPAISNRAR